MRRLYLIGWITLMGMSPALAEPTKVHEQAPVSSHMRHISHSHGSPVDHGPYTREANRAYQGGGMILEGAPGAPAPVPEATAQGQTPHGMVQQR
jgi:hypothetical protein